MARKTNCTKNGKPMFRITAVIGHDEKGRAKRKTFFGKSEKEATTKRDEFFKGLEMGLDIDFSKLTLRDAMHTWLFEVKKPDHNLKATSFNRYAGIYYNYIKDSVFASMVVSEIKSLHIQRFLNDLEKSGLTYSQMKNVYKLLKMFFIYATEEGYTTKNPCTRNIAIPGGKPKAKEVEVFTDEEVEKMKDALTDHWMRLPVLMALGTGLRRGEILALRYSDIAGGEVHVHSSLARPINVESDGSSSSEYVIWEPKSRSSIRRVPIPEDLQKEIASHRIRQIEQRMKLGIGGEPEFIFTTQTGNFIHPSTFGKAFTLLLKRADVPYKKFHALRHTYASMLVLKGADINMVQKLMGHSDINITSIYFHADRTEMKNTVEVLSKWFQ